MKILYISTAPVPEEWAHVSQIMKTCEAFAKAGHEVELVVPNRNSLFTGDAFTYFKMAPVFKITYLPTIDFMRAGLPFAFHTMVFSFLLNLIPYISRTPTTTAIYIRGELVLPIATLFGKNRPVFWETHIKPGRMKWYERILPMLQGVITVTDFYRTELIEKYKLHTSAVVTSPDGVDIEPFKNLPGKEELRRELDLPLDKTIILYAGSDVAWKGLATLREAALLLPQEYLVVFLGEITPDDADSRKRFVSFRPRNEVPRWLAAADVVALLGTSRSSTSMRYTSPLKLFEYLASGTPIVASDVPSFREVLDEKTARFAEPDSPNALADSLVDASQNPYTPAERAYAQEVASRYTWDARAAKILDFMAFRMSEVR